MAQITQNDINFSAVQDSYLFSTAGKYSHGSNNKNGKFNIGLDGDDIEKSINAVEIDWNGAQIDDNDTINSTGDLIRFRRWFAKTA